jgi:protein involved in polysaccharide export with SLBB domain
MLGTMNRFVLRVRVLGLLLALVLALGQGLAVSALAQEKSSATNKVPPAAEGPGNSTDVLHAGDRVTIILADIPMGPITQEYTITEDGYITLHYNVRVKAGGVTKGDLQEQIRTEYVDKKKYYLRMTVTVKTETLWFFVDGQVKGPNRYPYAGELTVLKAITAAGGFTDFAKKTKVQITRVHGKTEIVDCEKAIKNPKLDLQIFPGDRIWVDRRIF